MATHTLLSERTLSVLRIVAGLLFMAHGSMKLFGYPPSPAPAAALWSQMGVAGVLETFGGLLIVLGLLTRPVAFVLCGEMAVAYFQAHAPKSLFPVVNGGEPAVLFCFIFLYLAAAGGGAWSIDALWRPRGVVTSARDADVDRVVREQRPPMRRAG